MKINGTSGSLFLFFLAFIFNSSSFATPTLSSIEYNFSISGNTPWTNINKFDPRIVGGEPTTIEDHPWMVALVSGSSTNLGGQFCGGTVIAPLWVVTAAHCVITQSVEEIAVVTNSTDTTSVDPVDRIDVAAKFVHPDFSFTVAKNDIALLRLASPTSATPIALASADQYGTIAAEGTAAIVSGWGNRTAEQGEADYSSILHAVELSISDDAQCQDVYGEDLEDTLICAAVEGAEKDSCSGDSGGPLSVMVDGSPVQVGIVSFGFGCAQPGFPGVYTRVSKFDSFVSDIISQTFTITDSVNFVPAIDISSNLSETVTITSLTENVTLDISGAQLSLGNGLSIDQDSCSAQSLPAGKSCTIELLWNPVEASTLVDELTVELSDGANITKVVIPITGQALVQLDSSLAEVLDLPMQTYFHDDNADWVITDSEFFEGGSALISGDLSTTSTTGTTIFATKGPSEFGFSVKGVNTAMDILFNGELITGDIGFELVDEWLTLGFGGLDESNDLTLIFTATGSPATVNIDKFEIFDGTTFPDPVEPVGPTPVDPTPVDPTPVPNFGYVFERTDGGELRWIAPNNEGILGSVWIDAVCAELLGGVSAKGDWEELNNQAPALDSIAYPCGLVAADDLDGFVFERSDGGELRWITKNSEGINGSIWIDEECAGLLGGVEQVGDWADLNELAPGLDTVDYPCELGVIEGSQKPPPPGIDGFVFGRTDKDELRWIAPNNEGVLGSVWIDATCAEALGGVVLEGDWQELMEIAPGLDTIDPPC